MSRTTNPLAPVDTPILQPFYHWANNSWQPIQSSTPRTNITTHPAPLKTLRLTTWNIDFQAPCATERMNQALNYLSTLHNNPANHPTPSVIFLQEMVASDLLLIHQKPWIQENFYITDFSPENWGSRYGTTALVEKRLDVQRVFRVRYSASRMSRDGLFIDIRINGESPGGEGSQVGDEAILRLCNTHLESLVSLPPRRPMQMRVASRFLHGEGSSGSGDTAVEGELFPVPHAGILAGDLNAFAPEDQTAPEECGLRDAFLVLGGQEGTEESFTWGQQASEYHRHRFGCSRMDKVLFCGEVEVQSLEKIGAGQKVWIEYPQQSDSEESSETGEDMWVTDHIGLQAVFQIVG